MEAISDREMMAYGWCYSVNGIEPSLYSDEIQVQADDKIVWCGLGMPIIKMANGSLNAYLLSQEDLLNFVINFKFNTQV